MSVLAGKVLKVGQQMPRLNASGECDMGTAKSHWIKRIFSPAPAQQAGSETTEETAPGATDDRIISALVNVIVAENKTTNGLHDIDLSTESSQQLVRSRLLFLHSELSRIAETVDIATPDLIGMEYSDGLAAIVENGSDVDLNQTTYIQHVIEPLVVQGDRVLRPARVVLSNELPATNTGGY